MKEGTDKGVHWHSEWQKRKNTRLINNTFIWYIYIVNENNAVYYWNGNTPTK